MGLNPPCRNHPQLEGVHFCMVCQAHLCDMCVRPANDGSGAMTCAACGGQIVDMKSAAGKTQKKRRTGSKAGMSIFAAASGILTEPRVTLRNLTFDLAETRKTGLAMVFVLVVLLIGSAVRVLAVPPAGNEGTFDFGTFFTAVAIHAGVRLLGVVVTAIVLNLGAILTGEGAAFWPFLVTVSFLTAALELLAAPVLSLLQVYGIGWANQGGMVFFELWGVVLLYMALTEVYACDFISAVLIGVVGRGVVVIGTIAAWSWIHELLLRFGT